MRGLVASALLVGACTRPVDLVATSRDAGEGALDAGEDAPSSDAGADVAPPEAAVATPHVGCAGSASIVLTTGNALFSFDPGTDTLLSIGTLACPEAASTNVIALAAGDDGLLFLLLDSGEILLLPPGATTGCNLPSKAPAPPATANGAGFAIARSDAPTLYLGLDDALFQAPTSTPVAWSALAPIAAADHFRALLGTGDGRLFGVIAPGTKGAYRVTSIDGQKGTLGGTVLVPTALGLDPEAPAGFALWGDALLVFSGKVVSQYDFATGVQTAPRVVSGFAAPVIGATSPPCASTL